MKALIKVGYGCNDHCTFCHTFDVRHMNDSQDRVLEKIRRAAELGHSMVVLSGGEPTARPEIFKWARYANSLGMDFGLVTNGRMLSYPEFLAKLLERRLRYVYLSLHGGTAKIHDANVRSEAFEQTFGGLRNCSGHGLDLTANCVVTRVNVDRLYELVDAVASFEDVRLCFSMTEPKGNAMHLFEQIIPNLTYAAERVADAIRYARANGMNGRVVHGGFPLCLMPGLEDAYGDLKTHGFSTMTEVWESDFFPVDDRNKVQPAPCHNCGLRGPCPGLYRAYEERYGSDELRPFPALRSNSFNYARYASLGWPAAAPCPILESPTPYDPARTLLVRSGDVVDVFRTTTRDFSDVEIDEVKRSLGQVYLDTSRKHAPDDFAADLRKLVVLDECRTCPAYDGCTRCYRVVDEDVFTRDDAALRSLLGEVRGDVLDVGCGDARYGDAIEPLVRQGFVRYRGVEPDPDAAARLRNRWPWANIAQEPIEALELAPASLDAVLVLRSHNHLREPGAVFAALVRALRPHGLLLVADNVAFGLVRDHEQVTRGEQGPARFEHYRNDDAGQASRFLLGLPLVLTTRLDVGQQTSNQWVLGYRRTTDAAS